MANRSRDYSPSPVPAGRRRDAPRLPRSSPYPGPAPGQARKNSGQRPSRSSPSRRPPRREGSYQQSTTSHSTPNNDSAGGERSSSRRRGQETDSAAPSSLGELFDDDEAGEEGSGEYDNYGDEDHQTQLNRGFGTPVSPNTKRLRNTFAIATSRDKDEPQSKRQKT